MAEDAGWHVAISFCLRRLAASLIVPLILIIMAMIAIAIIILIATSNAGIIVASVF